MWRRWWKELGKSYVWRNEQGQLPLVFWLLVSCLAGVITQTKTQKYYLEHEGRLWEQWG